MSPGHFTLCGYPRCPEVAPLGESYCAGHKEKADRAQRHADSRYRDERTRREPWRAVYRTREYIICRDIVFERDGYQCVRVQNSERCHHRRRLQCHHRIPLATLWERAAGRWEDFVNLACNPDHNETLCPSCHSIEDERLRKEQQSFRDKSREMRYARPRTRPSKRHKRGRT